VVVAPWFNHGSRAVVQPCSRTMVELMVAPLLSHGNRGMFIYHVPYGSCTMVVPWYHGRFNRGTTMLYNLDRSPEVREKVSKIGSKINNDLFSCTPYFIHRTPVR